MTYNSKTEDYDPTNITPLNEDYKKEGVVFYYDERNRPRQMSSEQYLRLTQQLPNHIKSAIERKTGEDNQLNSLRLNNSIDSTIKKEFERTVKQSTYKTNQNYKTRTI